MLGRIVTFLCFGLLLAGCGSQSGQEVFASTSQESSLQQPGEQAGTAILRLLFYGEAAEGAFLLVTGWDADGNVLFGPQQFSPPSNPGGQGALEVPVSTALSRVEVQALDRQGGEVLWVFESPVNLQDGGVVTVVVVGTPGEPGAEGPAGPEGAQKAQKAPRDPLDRPSPS